MQNSPPRPLRLRRPCYDLYVRVCARVCTRVCACVCMYSSGQKKVPFRYYERTQLISVGVSDSFRFYAP